MDKWTRNNIWPICHCLVATPWTVVRQAHLSMGFSRQEYWSGLPVPSLGDFPNPGIKPASPAWQADTFLLLSHLGSPSSIQKPLNKCSSLPPPLPSKKRGEGIPKAARGHWSTGCSPTPFFLVVILGLCPVERFLQWESGLSEWLCLTGLSWHRSC